MLKHIFCDLDGTLYSDRITEKDLMAIKYAEDNGIKFSIATGRVYTHAVEIINETGINGYLICENGSYIYDKDLKCIFKGTMTDLQIKRIVEKYKSLDYINPKEEIIYFKYDGKVVIPVEVEKTGYFSKGFTVEEDLLERDTYDGLVGNLGIMTKNSEHLHRLVEDYTNFLHGDFDVYISSGSTMNIVPKGISKFDAIKTVCKRENITIDQIVTIGDSPNDIGMLSGAKVSFAMSDAADNVKSAAKYESPTVADAVKMVIDLNSVESEMEK